MKRLDPQRARQGSHVLEREREGNILVNLCETGERACMCICVCLLPWLAATLAVGEML